MLNTIRAVIHHGQIELLEKVELSEGTKLLVTLLPSDEKDFWEKVSASSLNSVGDNTEDDVFTQLDETAYLLSNPALSIQHLTKTYGKV